jgi:Flp pilus assembly pilin Flp
MFPIELRSRLARLQAEEAGQALIEYAFLAVLVAIVAIVFLAAIGLDLTEPFNAIEDVLGLGGENTVDPPAVGIDDAATADGVN